MKFMLVGIVVWVIKEKQNLNWPKTVAYFLLGLISIDILKIVLIMFLYGFNISNIVIIGLILFFIYYKMNEERRLIREWEDTDFPFISPYEFSMHLTENCDTSNIRYTENIPYNRAKYFSAGTEANQDVSFITNIFYDAKPADGDLSFMEYGFLVTSLGVVVNKQKSKSKKMKNNESPNIQTYLPFLGAYRIDVMKDILAVYYADRTKKTVVLNPEELDFISNVFLIAIDSGWTYHLEDILIEDNVTDEEIDTISKVVEDYDKKMDELDIAVESAHKDEKITKSNRQAVDIGVMGTLGPITKSLNQSQINDRFGKGQGHGHAGELFGDLGDKLRFKNTEMLGSSHEKYGADRVVDGINIQTKYHATPGKSIGQCFKPNNGGAKYLNADGSMMQIEVPKDQYDSALRQMARKIEQGQVPKENNPANAALYVKKGALTYEQAQIATKSIFDRKSTINVYDKQGKVVRDSTGNIVTREVRFSEKIIHSAGGDFLIGATAALPIGLLSGVWVYCNSVWNGIDNKEALKNSAIAVLKPSIFSGTIYMISSQFSGSQIGKKAGNIIVQNILKKEVSNKVKTEITTKITANTLTGILIIGPDIVECLRGRISYGQLVKNTVTTGVGIASGAAAGGAVGSVFPGVGTAVGTVIGGILGSMSANKIVDKFIEDDAVEMIQIAKEEFIEVVMMSGLSEKEFNGILEETFLHKKFSSLLKAMYAAESSRKLIRDLLVELVEKAYEGRKLPNEENLVKAALLCYEPGII